MINIFSTLLAALILSVVWFIAGGIVYMNPFVAKIYNGYKDHPSMKKWPSQKSYLVAVYLFAGLIPSVAIAFAYAFINPSFWLFIFILVGVRIIPRFFDMYMQTCYPNKILVVELINGTILSVVSALVLGWLI